MDPQILREAMTAYEAVYNEDLREEIDFQNWVNSLVEEGYDLSEYTWEEMYEEYLSERGGAAGAAIAATQQRQRQAQAQGARQALQQGRTLGVAGNFGFQSGTRVKMDSAATRSQGRTVVTSTNTQNRGARGGTSQARPNTIQLGGQRMYAAQLGGKDVYVGARPSGGSRPAPAAPANRPAPAAPANRPAPAAPSARPAASAPSARPAASAPSARPAASAPTAKPSPTPSASAPAKPTPTAPPPKAAPTKIQQDVADLRRMGAASMMRQQGRNLPSGKIPTGDDLKPATKAPVAKPSPTPSASAPAKPTPTPAASTPKPTPTPAASTPKPTPTPAKRPMGSVKPGSLVSGFDMFDVVKGYLIDEGFAETEESAIAIMANMSEEWKLEIIDEAVKGESSDRRKALAAERRKGIKPLSAKEGEKYATHKIAQMAYAKRGRTGDDD